MSRSHVDENIGLKSEEKGDYNRSSCKLSKTREGRKPYLYWQHIKGKGWTLLSVKTRIAKLNIAENQRLIKTLSHSLLPFLFTVAHSDLLLQINGYLKSFPYLLPACFWFQLFWITTHINKYLHKHCFRKLALDRVSFPSHACHAVSTDTPPLIYWSLPPLLLWLYKSHQSGPMGLPYYIVLNYKVKINQSVLNCLNRIDQALMVEQNLSATEFGISLGPSCRALTARPVVVM